MTVAETSLETFYNNQQKFTQDQREVRQIIKEHGPMTGSSVARRMKKPYHSISGRITELKNMDVIEVVGRTTNKFGNPARLYQVKSQ